LKLAVEELEPEQDGRRKEVLRRMVVSLGI